MHLRRAIAARLERRYSAVDVPDGLEVLGVVVVRGLEVDAVLRAGHCDGLLPATHGLVQLVEQVEAPALRVQVLCLLREPQVHGHGGHPRVQLGFLAGVAHRPRAPHVAHVAQRDGSLTATTPNQIRMCPHHLPEGKYTFRHAEQQDIQHHSY